MRVYYTDQFVLPLPAGHRFPMEKYALLRARINGSHATLPVTLLVPQAAGNHDLLRAHEAPYVERVVEGTLSRTEIRRIGFPWSPELVERSRRSVGATIEACRAALSDGVGVSLAGGTHHAYPDRGEGFCVFNDAGVAARTLQAAGAVTRVLVVDCDVHQGNGTARMFAEDPSVFTFDLCAAHNFPFSKEAGDLVIALDDGTGDDEYLGALERGLALALERFQPDIAIYLAGADPYEGDRLGRLSVSKRGLAERDHMVLRTLRTHAIPVAVTMSGGYAVDVTDTVDIHFQTVCIALGAMDASAPLADSRVRTRDNRFVS